MEQDAKQHRSGEILLSDKDFEYFRQLIDQLAGIKLAEGKKSLVHGRLSKRLEVLNLADFSAYRAFINSPSGKSELPNFVNALTTNTTYFFREPHHFDHLREVVTKRLQQDTGSDKTLMIWSAGCSAGDEPYSIAMVAADVLKNHYGWTAKILATDIDKNILAKAERGLYTEEHVDKVPPALRKAYLTPVAGGGEAKLFQVSPLIQKMVHFKYLNLLDTHWPMKQTYDCIFCRNTTIYFSRETQKELVIRYYHLLKPHGFLYMGHSETLMGVEAYYIACGKTVYQKQPELGAKNNI